MKDMNDIQGGNASENDPIDDTGNGNGVARVSKSGSFPIAPPRRDDVALRAVRATALSALRGAAPAVPWQRQAATMTVLGLAVTGLAAVATARLGGTASSFAGRMPALLLLLVAQGLALWSAIAPGRWWGRTLAWSAAAVGATLVLYDRAVTGAAASASADASGWICSASHLGVALLPAAVMLGFLRGISWSVPRALTAGLAVGISGLIWGEIACERSLAHVVIHHVGAMALMTVACAAIAGRLSRGVYAP